MPPAATLGQMTFYFLRLGATGFGGPVALANHMRRDLVDRYGWIAESEYEEGLALATACPGPLAYQLGVYCGYLRHGVLGALAAALAFALAPFLLVSAAAALYLRYSDAWETKALFYGIAPVIVALIFKACWQLGQKTLKKRWPAWLFAAAAAAITVLLRQELASLFVVAGLLGCLLFAPRPVTAPAPDAKPPSALILGIGALVPTAPAAKLFLFFFKAGLLVFGSGLVIAPFLKAYVVDQYHWLSDQQFIDAVAIGMITPGPVVITATFVGYLVDGFTGGAAATVGIFAPSVLFTLVAAPLLRRHRSNRYVEGFLRGIVPAVVGALFGTTLLVAMTALRDWPTMVLGAVALTVVYLRPKLPDLVLVLAAAAAGLGGYHWLHTITAG